TGFQHALRWVCTLTLYTHSAEGFLHSSFLSIGLMFFPCQTNRKAWLLGSPQSLVKQLWGKDSSKDFLGLSHVESVVSLFKKVTSLMPASWTVLLGLTSSI
ncbi:hypothetical protein Nmel_008906, partial [Mimus melanotis]